MPQLSDSQAVVLGAACQRADRSVYPLTTKLPGAAATKVLTSLLNKKLIEEVRARREDIVWREDRKKGRLTLRVTPAAFEALGIDQAEELVPANTNASEHVAEGDNNTDQSRTTGEAEEKTRATRADSKQARLVAMLKRPEGASIEEIVKAFEWQPHTVRGAIAGALKKKLGLTVTSEKSDERGRVYHVS